MAISDPVILENFSYQYESASKPAIVNQSLTVQEGECILVTGRSGCGKTTLMRCIDGLVPHFYEGMKGGKAFVYGMDVGEVPIHDVSERMGSVFQDPRSQFFTANTTSEIAFGLENIGVEQMQIKSRIEAVAEDLSIGDLLGRSVFELSSGEKQKIAIASVYAMEPSVIIFDEPSANLDIPSIYQIAGLMRRFKEKGHTVIVIEHRIFYLKGLLDRVLYMDAGKVVEDLSRSDFLALDEAQLKERGLRCFDLGRLTVGLKDQGKQSAEDFERTPVLSVRGLTVTAGKKTILEDISFDAYRGEVIGIVGTNGSGKTTLVKTLCGLMREKNGSVAIDGRELKKLRDRMSRTYYVMQDSDYQLFSETVNNELLLGNEGIDNLQDKAAAALEKMNLAQYRNSHPSSLSRGEKQRLTIAVSAIKNRNIQFFDEPTSGLDRGSMERVAGLLLDLKKQGKTLIVISHDYEFILNTCCRIIHIRDGRLKESYPLTVETKERLLELNRQSVET